MTKEERMAYRNAINVIDYKLLGKQHIVSEPTKEQMEAITLAVDSMEKRMKETEYPLGKHIAILRYHIKNPTALLFKDRNTLDALTNGIISMRWLMKDDMYEGSL